MLNELFKGKSYDYTSILDRISFVEEYSSLGDKAPFILSRLMHG